MRMAVLAEWPSAIPMNVTSSPSCETCSTVEWTILRTMLARAENRNLASCSFLKALNSWLTWNCMPGWTSLRPAAGSNRLALVLSGKLQYARIALARPSGTHLATGSQCVALMRLLHTSARAPPLRSLTTFSRFMLRQSSQRPAIVPQAIAPDTAALAMRFCFVEMVPVSWALSERMARSQKASCTTSLHFATGGKFSDRWHALASLLALRARLFHGSIISLWNVSRHNLALLCSISLASRMPKLTKRSRAKTMSRDQLHLKSRELNGGLWRARGLTARRPAGPRAAGTRAQGASLASPKTLVPRGILEGGGRGG